MREEIQQLKQEVVESNKAKEESEIENQQLKVDLEDAIMAKEEVEASNEEIQVTVKELKTAKEEAEAAKQSLEEFINTSSNTDEIEGLKQELKEMEEQLSTAAVISKLSATLVGLEESVLAAADCSMMPGGQDADCTLGNQTLGGGVPMEVVMEIKEQLLLLQNQLLDNDPEKMRSLEKENSRLKQQHQDLVQQVENARKGLKEDGLKEEKLAKDDEDQEEFESLKRKEE